MIALPDRRRLPIVFGRSSTSGGQPAREPRLTLGMLPLARRDVERLRQILNLQRQLTDINLSPRARRALMHRGPFNEALTWLEIHGEAPDVLEHWRGFIEAAAAFPEEGDAAIAPPRRRRRRRRRGRGFHGRPEKTEG